MPCRCEPEKGASREYPIEAFHLVAGAVRFLAPGDAGAEERIPIRMLARSTGPVFHPYWGKIAHDLSGMSRKPTVPVDWMHRADEVIGFIDRHEITPRGLEVFGELVPYPSDSGDRAGELVFRGRQGVPYEASIDFMGDGIVIEEVGQGASVEVNGYTFEGPGVVVREWPLRGIAICPHGADANTETKFVEGGGGRKNVSVQILKTENEPMSSVDTLSQDAAPADEPLTKKGFLAALSSAFGFGEQPADGDAGGDARAEAGGADAAQSADAGETEAALAAAEPAGPTAADVKAELKRFAEVFGDDGPKLFAEELSFEAAAGRVIGALRERNAELEKRLSAVDRGDTEGAEFNAGDDDGVKASAKDVANFGEGLAPLVAMNAAKLGRRN